MYGLWGYLLKAKALAPINARRVVEGGWYLKMVTFLCNKLLALLSVHITVVWLYWRQPYIHSPSMQPLAATGFSLKMEKLQPILLLCSHLVEGISWIKNYWWQQNKKEGSRIKMFLFLQIETKITLHFNEQH